MPPSTPPCPTQILLLGAGELGLALLQHISSLPSVHITLGVRSPSKHTSLLSTCHNLSLLALDLTSHSSVLVPVFAEYDIIISATGFVSGAGSVMKLAEEVLATGKMRQESYSKGKGKGKRKTWFFPWQWGVDYDITGDGNSLMPLFGEQKAVREFLRSKAKECGVRWTVVSTGIFMSFLFEEFWGIVDREKMKEEGRIVVRCLGDWEHGVTVTDVLDIGRVMKEILKAGIGEMEGQDGVIYVAGNTISYAKLAGVVERVSGVKVERETWSIPYLENELMKDPENEIKRYRLVFARKGVWWSMEQTVNHRLGMKMMDVETYAGKLFGVSR